MLQSYNPDAQVLEQLKAVDFVALVGPSAVGKTTLIKRATATHPKLHMLVTETSRALRPGEKDGVDFHFLKQKDMQLRVQQRGYATVVVGPTGDLYTTASEDYPTDKVSVMTPMAHGVPMFRALPFRSFRTIFVVPPSWDVWQKRLTAHGFTPQVMPRRMEEARTSLAFGLTDPGIVYMINDNLDQAVQDFSALALGKQLTKRQLADQPRARAIAQDMLDKLNREV